jgi:hypothetical protein
MTTQHQITIRRATSEDDRAVLRLALLDDRPAPRGAALLAFVDGELAAARSLNGRGAVADPFRRTAALLDMLEIQTRSERAAA